MFGSPPLGCVLVVDEDASFCVEASSCFARCGLDVRATSDAEEAVAFSRSGRPQLVLVDAELAPGAKRTAELIALVHPTAAIVLTAKDASTANRARRMATEVAITVIQKPLLADQARQLAKATLCVPAEGDARHVRTSQPTS